MVRVGGRLTEAKKHVISPYTIRLAIEAYEEARDLKKNDLGNVGKFMASVTKFVKECKTISQMLFPQAPPAPSAYVAVAREAFKSPFFEALREFSKKEQ